MTGTNNPTIYHITIEGRLKEKWAAWLHDTGVSIQNVDGPTGDTTIIAHVPDQAALRGLLNRVWDLNLTLISVRQHEEITWNGGHDGH